MAQLVVESLMLGGIGAALGLSLAYWIVGVVRSADTGIARLAFAEVDSRVLIFTVLVGVLTSLAQDQYKAGSFDKARETVDDALKLTPDSATLRVLSAKLAIEQGQLERGDQEPRAEDDEDARQHGVQSDRDDDSLPPSPHRVSRRAAGSSPGRSAAAPVPGRCPAPGVPVVRSRACGRAGLERGGTAGAHDRGSQQGHG